MALLPEGDHYGLVWTATPERAEALQAQDDAAFLAELARRFAKRGGGAFTKVDAAALVSPGNGVRDASPPARAASFSATQRRRFIRSPDRDSTSGSATPGSFRRSSSIRRATPWGIAR